MESSLKKRPVIYLITEGKATTENFSKNSVEILNIIRVAVESKIQLVQIREKNIPAKLVCELVSEAITITRNTETKVLVNDRADIAQAANADGVHLTSQSLTTEIIRQYFPKNFIAGVSAHTFEEANLAQEQGADFVTFSPVFKTPSKEKYGEPQGLEKLRAVCERMGSFPVIALGGIDASNFKNVLEIGASGFAAIRFLNDIENLRNLNK